MKEIVKPKLLIGLAVFFLVIILLLFVATPMQLAWGMWGLAATEIMILAAAVIPALLYKWDLKQVFPLGIPSTRQVFGVLMLWLGSYLVVTTISLIIICFFPQGLPEISRSILELFQSTPFPVTLFIAAVMPAVCEEALHRGLIQYTFGPQKKWVLVVVMGFIFGLFHLDPYRFLGTAILGAVMTLIMVETNNLVLPALFHFVNNAVSTFASYQAEPPVATDVAVPLVFIGAFLIITAVAPFLLVAGNRLLKSKATRETKAGKKTDILAAVAAAVLLFIAGVAITATTLP